MTDSADSFRPAPWLRGPHAQTVFPYLFRPRPRLPWRPERLELPDGDFVDLAHLGEGSAARVCLFHGLEGCVKSHYVGGLARVLRDRGLGVTLMHFRGCSGEPNRLPRAYHSGDTGDIAFLIDTLHRRERAPRLGAVGFSLGGNALLKYLGERGDDTPLTAGVAVSVPFDLSAAAHRIDRGLSRIYQAFLLRRMRASTRARADRLGGLPVDLTDLGRLRDFRAFDDRITAPLHGFAGVDDYYGRSSARACLPAITRPTLILHARDDPFVGREAIPSMDEAGPGVELAISERGGHVGFVAAGPAGRPDWWLDRRISDWFALHLDARSRSDRGRRADAAAA